MNELGLVRATEDIGWGRRGSGRKRPGTHGAKNCSPGFFNFFVIFVCFCADFLRDSLQRAGFSISIFRNQFPE
jgi:hypothetical protein